MLATHRTGPRGFTLIELLVVITIIALISAIALPTILPALNERRVSESARLLQAILAGARDTAIRANSPRGIRLLPDPVFNGLSGSPLASNRIIPIEPAPEYLEGLVDVLYFPIKAATTTQPAITQLRVSERLYTNASNPPTGNLPPPIPSPVISNPTSWYWNIRQGDRIRFNNSGPYYTIAGPMLIGPNKNATGQQNTDRFINNGVPNPTVTFPRDSSTAEYLILTNGLDDDNDGFTDESFDGMDNDGDRITDPAFNGLDDDGNNVIDDENTYGEYENETIIGALASSPATALLGLSYTIYRRPVVSPGAREVTLPAGIVVDLTTWNAATSTLLATNTNATINPTLQPERSRLPVDPYTYYVDIMISPNGQVVQGGAGGGNGDFNSLAPSANQPFYHFWLTEREGVVPPIFGLANPFSVNNTNINTALNKDIVTNIPNLNPNYGSLATSQNYMLPMPQGTPNYTPPTGTGITQYLTGERRLVTLFVKTGQITTNSISFSVPNPNDPLHPIGSFNGYDTNAPYYDAQAGVKEPL